MSQQKRKTKIPLIYQPKFKLECLLADLDMYEKLGKELSKLLETGFFKEEATQNLAREILSLYRVEYSKLSKEADRL